MARQEPARHDQGRRGPRCRQRGRHGHQDHQGPGRHGTKVVGSAVGTAASAVGAVTSRGRRTQGVEVRTTALRRWRQPEAACGTEPAKKAPAKKAPAKKAPAKKTGSQEGAAAKKVHAPRRPPTKKVDRETRPLEMDPRVILTRGVSTGLRLGRGTADRVVHHRRPAARAGSPARWCRRCAAGPSDTAPRRSLRRSGATSPSDAAESDVAKPEPVPAPRSTPSPAAVARNIGPPRPAAKPPGRPGRRAAPGRSCHLRAPAPPSRPAPCRVTFPTRRSSSWSAPSGSGKSTWAAARYRRDEIVSSDALRGVVGSGPHDLDATADAFDAARADGRRPRPAAG